VPGPGDQPRRPPDPRRDGEREPRQPRRSGVAVRDEDRAWEARHGGDVEVAPRGVVEHVDERLRVADRRAPDRLGNELPAARPEHDVLEEAPRAGRGVAGGELIALALAAARSDEGRRRSSSSK
jgi:hypothetical protein